MPSARSAAAALRAAASTALAILLPVHCAGCGAADRAVCTGCAADLVPAPHEVERAGLAVWAGLRYERTAARVIRAYKDEGRTDAAPALAAPLSAAIGCALAALPAGAPIEVCTMPSTVRAVRSRGYAPVERLLARCGVRAARVLRIARERVDQAGLAVGARQLNADGAFCARASLHGRRFLLVDDVLTTGATLRDAERALRAAGAEVAAAAVLAQTPLRNPGRMNDTGAARQTLRDFVVEPGYGVSTGVVQPPFSTG